MEPILKFKSHSDYVAGHFTRNYPALGDMSYKDMTSTYGVSTGVARAAVVNARGQLAAQGKTITCPNPASGFKVTVVDDNRDYARSKRTRYMAVTTEVTNDMACMNACLNQDPVLAQAFNDFQVAWSSLTAAIAAL